MLALFKRVAYALRTFPFGFLPKKLNVAEFVDVAHVRSCAGTHVHSVPNLHNSKFLHTRWKQIHVGSVGGHDGIDFITGHDGVGDF